MTSGPRILLRSSWQTANIGDVAHAPGALRALSDAVPEAQLTLWPRHLDDRERTMLAVEFPAVDIVDGAIDAHGAASTQQLQRAWDDADLLVHGPAAAIVETVAFTAWRVRMQRPYGYFGVSIDPMGTWASGTLPELRTVIDALPAGHMDPDLHDLLSGAAFVYCRDSLSLAYARGQGVKAGTLEWAPDATFAFDVRADDVAGQFLRTHGLANEEFTCVVPRTRYVPYHRLRQYTPGPRDLLRDALNAAHIDRDLGVLTEIIVRTVRDTGQQVLICPEMRHAVELAIDEIMPRLPADVRPHVSAVSDYWEVHHAAAVYARARAVVSMECHSPILAIGQGTPALYLRLPTETVKGAMFGDLGLDEVTVELRDGAADVVIDRVAALNRDQAAATGAVRAAHLRALERLKAAARQALLPSTLADGSSTLWPAQ